MYAWCDREDVEWTLLNKSFQILLASKIKTGSELFCRNCVQVWQKLKNFKQKSQVNVALLSLYVHMISQYSVGNTSYQTYTNSESKGEHIITIARKMSRASEYLSKTNAGIIFLQDTHWTAKNESIIMLMWKEDFILNGISSN